MAILYWGTRPCLCLYGNSTQLITTVEVSPDTKVEISFIHSVQKTRVEELLTVDELQRGFVLQSTRYHSFGVGLPFMETDGNFHQDGNTFVMDDMNRHFNELNLRTGVGTELTVKLDGKSYRLYEMFEPGEEIDIRIAPRGKVIWEAIKQRRN